MLCAKLALRFLGGRPGVGGRGKVHGSGMGGDGLVLDGWVEGEAERLDVRGGN